MRSNQWEVVILKPTRVFLTFLASQAPQVVLPDLRLLQVDNTAYAIPKQHNDEETLNEIERHFIKMFKHEVCRWLGNEIGNNVTGSFLDFLCCFKFELHSQILIMEESFTKGEQLLRVQPRSMLLEWMRDMANEQSEFSTILNTVDLTHLAENATVIVKNFQQLSELKPFLTDCYKSIFETEMFRMCDEAELWPEIDSYETFTHYFALDIHTQLIHLH